MNHKYSLHRFLLISLLLVSLLVTGCPAAEAALRGYGRQRGWRTL